MALHSLSSIRGTAAVAAARQRRTIVWVGLLCFLTGLQLGFHSSVASRATKLLVDISLNNTIARNEAVHLKLYAGDEKTEKKIPAKETIQEKLRSMSAVKSIQPKAKIAEMTKTTPSASKMSLPKPAESLFYNFTAILNPSPLQKREKQVEYPFVPNWICKYCGLDQFQNGYSTDSTHHRQSPALQPLHHSIAYIKPHKTGSSTIANVLNRILYGRGAIKMIPNDLTYLGWNDGDFPGAAENVSQVLQAGDGGDKYDAFNNHAVLTNRTHLSKFLKDPVFVTTILRDPLERTISAFNFFKLEETWDDYLRKYGKNMLKLSSWKDRMAANNLAYALGWYHQPHIAYSTAMDRNASMIQEFLGRIDDELDLVMMLDRLPESLVLLKEKGLPELDPTELVWMDYDGDFPSGSRSIKTRPTKTQLAQLRDVLFLDSMIYDHFRTMFEQRWKQAAAENPNLERMKQSLVCTADKLSKAIKNANAALSPITSNFYRLQGSHFTRILLKRQQEKYGFTK